MEHIYFEAQLCINISNFNEHFNFLYIYHSTLGNSLQFTLDTLCVEGNRLSSLMACNGLGSASGQASTDL